MPVARRLGRLTHIPATNLVHDAAHRPVPASRLGRAASSNLRDAYEQANQRLLSAEDHLRTVHTLLTCEVPLPSFSLFTLVRAAAIAAVHARYLLDPTIGESARLGRGLSARLQNLRQQRKVLPDFASEHFRDRVEHLRLRAERHGVAVLSDSRGRITGFGDGWPTDTELCDRYVPMIGKEYFQYLSGYAHSLPWAQVPMHRARRSDDSDVGLVPTDMNVPVFGAVLTGALDIYDEAVGNLLYHAGYPPEVWRHAKRE